MTLKDYAEAEAADCCGNCRFAELTLVDPKTQMLGVMCRRYPPVSVMINGQGVNMMPNSWANGWCGEHRRGDVHVGRGDFFGARVREAREDDGIMPIKERSH